jgi:hypothetical protein
MTLPTASSSLKRRFSFFRNLFELRDTLGQRF